MRKGEGLSNVVRTPEEYQKKKGGGESREVRNGDLIISLLYSMSLLNKVDLVYPY